MMLNFTDVVQSDKLEVVFNTYGPEHTHLSYFNNKDTIATMKLYLDLANFVLKNWKLDEKSQLEDKKEVPFWYVPKMQLAGLSAEERKTKEKDDEDEEESLDLEGEEDEQNPAEKKKTYDSTKEASTKVNDKLASQDLSKNKL